MSDNKISGGGGGLLQIDIEDISKMIFQGIKGGAGIASGAVTSPAGATADMVVNALGLPPILSGLATTGIGIATADPLTIVDGSLGIASELINFAEPYVEYPTGTIDIGIDDKGRFGYSTDLEWDGFLPFDMKEQVWMGPNGVTWDLNIQPGGSQKCPATTQPGTVKESGAHTGTPVKTDTPVASSGETPPGVTAEDLAYRRALETLEHHYDTVTRYESGVYQPGEARKDLGISESRLRSMAKHHSNPEVRKAAQFLLDHPELLSRAKNASGYGTTITRGELKAEIFRLEQKIRDGELVKSQSPSSGSLTPPTPKEADPAEPPPTKETEPSPPPAGETTPPKAGPAIPTTGFKPPWGQADFDAILNDPTLSIEDKILMILAKIQENLDAEAEHLVMEMASSQKGLGKKQDAAQAAAKDGDAGNANEEVAESQASLTTLQFQMQRVMERRSQMTQLSSNLSSQFHQMAMSAVNNIGRI